MRKFKNKWMTFGMFGLPIHGRKFNRPDEEDGPPGGSKENPQDAIIDKLSKINDGTEARLKLSQYENDPEIRRILDARAQGKKYKVLDEEVKEEEKEEEIPVEELDAMPNSKLLKLLETKLGKKIQSLAKTGGDVDEKLKPIAAQLGQIMAHLNGKLKEEGNVQLRQLQEKYDDFPKWKEKMAELAQKNPDLTLEELYELVKKRNNSPIVDKKKMASERPGGINAREPVTLDKNKIKDLSSNRAYDLLVAEAARRIDLDQFPE